MKKILPVFLIVILLLAGSGFLLFPQISNFIALQNRHLELVEYFDEVDQMEGKLINTYWENAQAYNQRLVKNTFSDPFASYSQEGLDTDYLNTLNIDNIMGRVLIPAINVDLPIYHGTSEEAIRKGAGHLPGSSLPIGGESVHAVLTSHSGLVEAKLFTDLEKLEIGDLFYLHILDQILAYQVDQILVVEPGDTEALLITEGEDYVTLITCTPYAINSHRLLVRGTRTELTGQEAARLQSQVRQKLLSWYCIIPAVILTGLLLLGLILFRHRKLEKATTKFAENNAVKERDKCKRK